MIVNLILLLLALIVIVTTGGKDVEGGGGGGGGEEEYDITTLDYTDYDNLSWTNNTLTLNKEILSTSAFDTNSAGDNSNQGGSRCAHYFKLDNFSFLYLYTFEITASNIGGTPSDTIVYLYANQTLPVPKDGPSGNAVEWQARGDDGGEAGLSKLSDQVITGNKMFIVTAYDYDTPASTGTFTLKIIRTLVPPEP